MANINAWVDDETALRVKERADKYHNGKVSAYVSSLVRKDLDGGLQIPTTETKDPLIALSDAFTPAETEDWHKLVEKWGINQKKFIAAILNDWAEDLADAVALRPGELYKNSKASIISHFIKRRIISASEAERLGFFHPADRPTSDSDNDNKIPTSRSA